ncbi:Muskelin 1 [Conglomerata obtusa]
MKITDHTTHQLLDYTVSAYSSAQPNFHPDNLRTDDPSDGNSRWAASTSDKHQFIILKLKRPALITAITFGKFNKLHISNVKDFQVYSYNDLNDMEADSVGSSVNSPSIDGKKVIFDKENSIKKYTNSNCAEDLKRKVDSNDIIENQNSSVNKDDISNSDSKNDRFKDNEPIEESIDNVEENKMKNDNKLNMNNVNASKVNEKNNLITDSLDKINNYSSSDYPFVNTQDNPILVFEGMLSNDNIPEIFPLKISSNNMFILTRYLKIVPMQTWGINMNYCLWHVKLQGITNRDILLEMIKHNYRIITYECYKMIYKFLRREKKNDIINHIQNSTKIKTESEIVNKIRDLVFKEDFEGIENLFYSALKKNLIDKSKYVLGDWKEIRTENRPRERGGHAMISFDDQLYLQGGWDGKEEIGDFWKFNCSLEKWTDLKVPVQKRSCHRMIVFQNKRYSEELKREMYQNELDIKNKCRGSNLPIVNNEYYKKFYNDKYTEEDVKLGKIDENQIENYIITVGKFVNKDAPNIKMDLHLLNVQRRLDFVIDYQADIENIYDHQLINVNNNIYLMGGRILNSSTFGYGKLYEFKDRAFKEISNENLKGVDLQERIGHNLVYYENKFYNDFELFKNNEKMHNSEDVNIEHFLIARRNLLIIGGQKDKLYFKDISFYDLDTKTVYKRVPFPYKGTSKIIQRCDIIDDCLVILFCYQNNKTSCYDHSQLYQYHILNNEWQEIPIKDKSPKPRSAHTFCYNSLNKHFFLFGGNINEHNNQKRCNDLWKLKLENISDEKMMNKIKFCVRKYKYYKLIDRNLNQAVQYLQNDIYDVVDHSNVIEEKNYKKVIMEIYKQERNYSVDEIVRDLSQFLKKKYKLDARNMHEYIF